MIKSYFGSVCIAVALITGSVQSYATTHASTALAPTKAQSETTKDIIEKLSKRHYRNLQLDDSLSESFLNDYLVSLDPARLYFVKSDIDTFYKHKADHDDFLKAGNLQPGFDIYAVYRQRVEARLNWVLAQLRDEDVKFEFDSKDYVEIDRKDSPWPATAAEADELWRQRLKLSVLNLVLADKTVEEARETLERRYTNQLKRTSQQKSHDVFETLINAFTTLYDPHTNYFSPRTSENFNINMSLQLEGIGAVLQSEDEHTKVVRLVPGGPAARQGELQPADKIVGVGQGDKGEIVDVVGWRLDEVVELIRGKKDSVVKLEVVSLDAKPKVVEIKRGTVQLEDQAAQKAVLEVSDGERMRKLGVINIPAFYHDFAAFRRGDANYRSTSRDVARLLSELQQQDVEGIILDLRNNGGGSLQEATMLTDLFIDQGPVVQIREASGNISQTNRSRSRAVYRGPLVVMINRLSASASEIFAGAIQDYRRGVVVGSQSFGKGTVQLLSDLPEGQLKLTESKFYRVSGDSTQHRGVIPDIAMPMLIDKEAVGESAYPNALPWDRITPAKHGVYFNFEDMMPTLAKLHTERAANDPDLVNINDRLELVQRNRNRKTVSLNHQERILEKEQMELEQMALENKRRKAKGLEVFASLKAFQEHGEEEKKKDALATAPKPAIDVESDALLQEAGYIMLDVMDVGSQPANQQVANF